MKEYNVLSIMLDCSRNAVPNIDFLKKFVDIISSPGYNELQLYTEDTYEIENEPYFGYLRGRFSAKELREIDGYCKDKGVELVPCIQTLAHLDNIFRWKRFSDLRDSENALLADDERTYEFIEEEFKTIAGIFTSRKVNIGMDEAHGSGIGEHLKRFGYEKQSDIFFRHLGRVANIAKKYGFSPMLWSDMFFKYENNNEYYSENPKISDDAIKKLPDNATLVYWDYNLRDDAVYNGMLAAHKKIAGNNFRWSGAAWSWLGLVPHNDYALAAMKAAVPVMKKNGLKDFMLTMWGDDGAECPRLSNLPSIFYFSEIVKGNYDEADIADKFYKRFGIKWNDFLEIDSPNLIDDLPLDVYDPAKYMLYNDCFLGIFDSTVNADGVRKYKAKEKRLSELKSDKNFGYMFETEALLCKILALKYSIGVDTRRAYKASDKEEIAKLIKRYKQIEKNIAKLYDNLKRQWHAENKPFGIEVQAARIGGLLQRVKDCRERLSEFVEGKIKRIEELEAEILDYSGEGRNLGKISVVNNSYKEITSAGYN